MKSKLDNERIGIKITSRTLKRLQKHISTKNFSDNLDLTQQDWIVDAIAEKLEREKNGEDSSRNILKQVSIRIDEPLLQELDSILSRLKEQGKRSRSFSKKGWILEAIEEKLDRDGA